jgi:N utilization substance protein B
MTASDPSAPPRARRGKRTASPRTGARIAAVQALYQIEMSSAAADQVIAEFREHRLGSDTDAELFANLTAATWVRRLEIDGLIKSALAEGWTIERLDAVMRALLRAGVCELLDFPDVPKAVVIDQYLEVAHAFLGQKETGFVNGLLDRLARRLRPQEVKAPADESADQSQEKR